jgi:DNA-directed RNA polymerase specialized sigma24 family protein
LNGTSSDDSGLNKEKFDRMLAWLHADQNEAVKQYVKISFKLFKYFERRLYLDQFPCLDAEELADKTIDRVCLKMPHLADNYEGEPVKYFYGVAKYVYQEYTKDPDRGKKPLPDPPPFPPDPVDDPEQIQKELRHRCLEECMKHFSAEECDLLLRYFQDDKKAKIDHRKELAEKLKISLNTLRVRIYRLKETLEEYIFDCMKKAQA